MEERITTKAIPIRNRSKMDQFVIIDGERLEIQAYATKVVAPYIADAFTEKCSPHVVREDGVSQIDDGVARAQLVWLMNTTGDPDAPPEVEYRRQTKQGPVVEMIPNPKHQPIIIRQVKDGGQVQARVRGEDTVLNMGSTEITVWPYSRKAFDVDTANWLLRRDGTQMETMRGCLKVAREPGGHEPNDSWHLDDLQMYAKVLGISAVGKKMSTLKKDASKGKTSLDVLVDEVKTELLKRLFFRIADKEYPIPSKEEWDAYKAKHADAVEATAA